MSKLMFIVLVALNAFADPLLAPSAPVDYLMFHEQNYLARVNGDPDVFAPDTNLQAMRFRPAPGRLFQVKTYWVPARNLTKFTSSDILHYPEITNQMVKMIDGKPFYRFMVHPESEVFYRDFLAESSAIRDVDYWAEPGASPRSLRVYPEGHRELAFFAKLSLNRMIGEVRRTLKGSELARSVGTTNTLAYDEDTLPKEFVAFPEVMGLIPNGMERGGMLIRAIPQRLKTGPGLLIPLFALYGRKDSTQPTLLEKMVERSGMTPEDFVVERIIRPFLKVWLKLAVEHGITMEAHGQNVLIGLQGGMPDETFGFRDFGGFNIDIAFRARRGIGNAELPQFKGQGKDYMPERHATSLRESLHDYFASGVMYDLDKLYKARWQAFHYREDHLQQAVQVELDKMIHEKDPSLTRLYNGFVNLAPLIDSLRDQENFPARAQAACWQRLRRANPRMLK